MMVRSYFEYSKSMVQIAIEQLPYQREFIVTWMKANVTTKTTTMIIADQKPNLHSNFCVFFGKVFNACIGMPSTQENMSEAAKKALKRKNQKKNIKDMR